MEHFHLVKDKLGKTLGSPQEIIERWRTYFEEMSSIASIGTAIPPAEPAEGQYHTQQRKYGLL
ncbi:unnamed protein product [Strongylus vulgaris]|uniref:Uncharacterized protein n=1 Tax=Strongylus vulgaris TaxID=40348 RepID=A0A3P7ILK1_STRVU|nr:unnamed protein product [Strongylus vulgaris]